MRLYSRMAAIAVSVSLLSACSGGSGGGSSPATASPTATPTSGDTGSTSESYYTCPSADDTESVTTAAAASTTGKMPRRAASSAQYVPGLLEVTYSSGYATSAASAIAAREQALGAKLVHTLSFQYIGRTTHVLRVNPNSVASTMSNLKSQSGVESVQQVGLRSALTVSAPYYTNNPYFKGYSGTTAPYYETSSIPGEWDAHATKLEYAFAYSQSADYSSPNSKALGSSSVAIAMIDTGQDTAHPELSGKITRQRCFITNDNPKSSDDGVQSTSDYTTDPQGHGTDTAGIAADVLGSGIGFAGAGGNVSLFGYRVFPTPDSFEQCEEDSATTNDLTCSATTPDIADAIDDAVTAGANIISLSLGSVGSTCTDGKDPDTTEGDAIENAISHDVIVVAAAGNDGDDSLEAPACDSGVIAVGASALADGKLNGAGNSDGSASSPIEYIASYSDWGSTNTVRSTSSWGIVAPGGDPNGDTDTDNLHWIQNIWPPAADLYSPDDGPTYCGEYPSYTSDTNDCQVEIAGTSMATPRVAGAAALLLSVDSSLQSPTAMKAALCDYADDLGSGTHQGCGRLNVYTSMAHAIGDPDPPTPVP